MGPLGHSVPEHELVTLGKELNRYVFLLTVGPPRLTGITGVPVNPIAIF
jgi:hypothetical protein